MYNREFKWINSVVFKEDFLYCIPGKGNKIFVIDTKNWKIVKGIQLKHENSNHWMIYEDNDKIYCIPKEGKQFAVYRIKDDECEYHKFQDEETEIVESVCCKQTIWFIPRNLPCKMYGYSIEKSAFFENIAWSNQLKRLKVMGRVTRWFVDGERVYLVFLNERRILQYDFCTNHMSEISVPMQGGKNDIYDIVPSGGRFYLLTKENQETVYCWNPADNSLIEIHGTGTNSYIKLINMGDSVLVDAGTKLAVLQNNAITEIGIVYDSRINGANFISAVKHGNRWIILPWGRSEFIEIEEDLKNYFIHKLRVPISSFANWTNLFYEPEFSLGEYIEEIKELQMRGL